MISYVGRDELRHMMKSWNHSNAMVSVTGPRRMGTTSTLNIILAEAKRNGKKAVYIDLRVLPKPITKSAVTSALFMRLGYRTKGEWKVNTILQSVNRPIPPLAVAIDEFDIVQSEEAHSLLGFLAMILPSTISLASSRHGKKGCEPSYSVFIGSRQSLFDIERATQCVDSPWYQNYQIFNLRPLTRKEALRMICTLSSTAGRSLEGDAAWLIRFAGTWPFFLKLASHHAFRCKHSTAMWNLTRKLRAIVEERVWEEAIPHLDAYWSLLNSRQRDLLANLRTWSRSGPEGRFDPDIMKLTRDGIIKITGTKVNYSSSIFSLYFPRKEREEPLSGHSLPPPAMALASIAEILSRLGACTAVLSNWDDSKEANIQEIAYAVLRSQYHQVSRERPAGEGPSRNYVCDIQVQDVDVLVEIKRVRNRSHIPRLQAEINDDLVGYRHNDPKQKVVFLIWDRERYVGDREYFSDLYESKDLNLRIVFAP